MPTKERRERVWRKVLKREGGRCFYCDTHVIRISNGKQTPNAASLDHITPKLQGGSYGRGASNLVLACWSCNNERGSMDAAAFLLHRRSQMTTNEIG